MAPGTTRTPSSRVFSGTRSWYWKSRAWARAIGSSRNASRMARLARSSTTTSPEPGTTWATRAWPASIWSMAVVTSARAEASSGVSRDRNSHSSSMRADSGESNAAGAAEPDASFMAPELSPAAGLLTGRWSPSAGDEADITPRADSDPPRDQPSAGTVGDVPRRRQARRRGVAIFMTCVVVLLGAGAWFAYSAYHHVSTLLISAGCQVGSGQNTV